MAASFIQSGVSSAEHDVTSSGNLRALTLNHEHKDCPFSLSVKHIYCTDLTLNQRKSERKISTLLS